MSTLEQALHCHQGHRLLLDTVKFESEPLVANYCCNEQKEMKHPHFSYAATLKEFTGMRVLRAANPL